MKKLLLLCSALFLYSYCSVAQSSLSVIDINNGMASVANNSTISYTTVISDHITTEIDAENTSNATKYYKLRRFDDVLNTDASAYFCVGGGNCYPPSVFTSPITVTLTPNQTLSSQNLAFLLDLEEGVSPGYSSIRYQIYNVNDLNDVFTFTLKYNDITTSIKESSVLVTSTAGVYPNPTNNKAYINIVSTAEVASVITITNSLGSIVSSKHVTISSGKNNIFLDSENLVSGIYFATITSGNNKIVKKFTVNK
ncbi:MAG: T9SS type A sorting domain-containing protein [Bacteroidota bacterium]